MSTTTTRYSGHLLAIIAMRKAHRSETGRLLICWVVVNLVLLYMQLQKVFNAVLREVPR